MPKKTIHRLCERCNAQFVPRIPSARFCSKSCFYQTRREQPIDANYWKHVQKTDGCWLWTAHVAPSGYGGFGVRGKHYRAHRFAYELAYGAFDQSLLVCHKCDNRLCVRPDHLFLGTQSDNLNDASRKGRIANGERNGNSKLTEQQVQEILWRYSCGETLTAIASDYRVWPCTIHTIVNRKTWKHLTVVSRR